MEGVQEGMPQDRMVSPAGRHQRIPLVRLDSGQ